jgi:hypothetical protein
LKSRVNAISCLLFFAFVFLPTDKRSGNILLLPSFRAATHQNHESLTVLPKIDAVARAEVDPDFKET